MLTYIGLLYEDICRNKANLGPQGELPEIWPIVLFNGDTPWTAPLTVNAVAEEPGAMGIGIKCSRSILCSAHRSIRWTICRRTMLYRS